MDIEQMMQDPRMIRIMAQKMADRGIEPPRELMAAGMRKANEAVKQQLAQKRQAQPMRSAPQPQQPQQAPAGPLPIGQMMNPQVPEAMPKSMPQVPMAPSKPAAPTGLGDLMTPRNG